MGVPTVTSEAVFAQPAAFPEFLKPSRQPLADALGVVVGFVVVRRRGHECSFNFESDDAVSRLELSSLRVSAAR